MEIVGVQIFRDGIDGLPAHGDRAWPRRANGKERGQAQSDHGREPADQECGPQTAAQGKHGGIVDQRRPVEDQDDHVRAGADVRAAARRSRRSLVRAPREASSSGVQRAESASGVPKTRIKILNCRSSWSRVCSQGESEHTNERINMRGSNALYSADSGVRGPGAGGRAPAAGSLTLCSCLFGSVLRLGWTPGLPPVTSCDVQISVLVQTLPDDGEMPVQCGFQALSGNRHGMGKIV